MTLNDEAREALRQIHALRWLQQTTKNSTYSTQNHILRRLDPITLTQVAMELQKEEQEKLNAGTQK
jgi:hypothetical protein